VTGRQAPHTFTSGGAQVLGLNIKDLPTDSADEASPFVSLREGHSFLCVPKEKNQKKGQPCR